MIKDVQLVLNGDRSSDQIAKRAHDSFGFEVPGPIVVAPNDQDARMVTIYQEHQLVKQLEVFIIVGEEYSVGTEGSH